MKVLVSQKIAIKDCISFMQSNVNVYLCRLRLQLCLRSAVSCLTHAFLETVRS
eukprot:m.341194 g.341194  ORF g.341194 m.341194 type:complete len:53 (-) comp20606_c0_seq8:16-174(-)